MGRIDTETEGLEAKAIEAEASDTEKAEEKEFNPIDLLTPRECEIAAILAWGESKKYIENELIISYHTVDKHTRNIFRKAGVNTVNALSAWWFCNKYKISSELSPLKKSTVAVLLLFCLLPREVMSSYDTVRRNNRRTQNTEQRANRSLRVLSTRGRARCRDSYECDLQLEF